MRTALLFPPSLPPTSPPCGVAYLKSFIKCKAFDLNLTYYETAVRMLNEGNLPVEADIQGYVLEPENLKEAINFFKSPDFYNLEEYNRHVSIFLSYFNKIDFYMREECMKHLFEGTASEEALNLLDEILSPVLAYHPDLVGFSQLVLPQREFVLGLAKTLKTEEIPLIVGGASLSQSAESYLSVVGGVVDLSHLFDAAFYGEGELPLKAYMEGEDVEKIPNAVYKKEKIVKNRESGIEDLDVLSCPDFSDFTLKNYYSPEVVFPLLTSRGCYWRRCTFCVHYSSYYQYRSRSVEKVLSDVRELQKKYDAHYFLFADEMIHPKKCEELSETILEEGLNLRFYSEVKPTKDFKPLLKKMYESGARALLWGVESGNQRILDLIDKGTTVEEVETVLKESHDAGIWNMVFTIMGYPTQTEKEVEEDILFLRRNEPHIDTMATSLFQLEVGSRIHEHPERFGIKKVERSPDPFSTACVYEVSEGLMNREAYLLYGRHGEVLKKLNKGSQYFGRLRDHMLLYADSMSRNPLRTE